MGSKTEGTMWERIKTVVETGVKSDPAFCLGPSIEKTNSGLWNFQSHWRWLSFSRSTFVAFKINWLQLQINCRERWSTYKKFYYAWEQIDSVKNTSNLAIYNWKIFHLIKTPHLNGMPFLQRLWNSFLNKVWYQVQYAIFFYLNFKKLLKIFTWVVSFSRLKPGARLVKTVFLLGTDSIDMKEGEYISML